MKLIKFLIVTLMVGLLFLGGQGLWAAPKTIKFGMVVSKHHIEGQLAEKFKEIVEAKTKIKVDIYPGGQLGKYRELYQGVKMGAVQMSTMPTSFITPFYEPVGLFDLPFLFKDYAHVDAVFQGSIGEQFGNRFMKDTGIQVMGHFGSGFQGFYTSKKFVKNMKDMKGLKMRVMPSPVLVDSMNAYGAKAVPMSLPEFYTGMQQGVVDGGENSIGTYEAQKHYEVAKYYTISNHKYLPMFVIMNDPFFKALSSEEQKVVVAAGKEAAAYARGVYGSWEAKSKKKASAGGAKWTQFDPGADQAFIKVLQPVYQKYGAKIEGGLDLLKQIEGLRK
jgi:tripartite ATP-independent transporter DctP family solute receptor